MPSDTQVYVDKQDRNVSHVYAQPGRRVIVHSTATNCQVGVVDVPAVEKPEPPPHSNGLDKEAQP